MLQTLRDNGYGVLNPVCIIGEQDSSRRMRIFHAFEQTYRHLDSQQLFGRWGKNKNSARTFRNQGMVLFMMNLRIDFGKVLEEYILFILFVPINGERKYRRHVGIMPHWQQYLFPLLLGRVPRGVSDD
jgi:hypothetical protein